MDGSLESSERCQVALVLVILFVRELGGPLLFLELSLPLVEAAELFRMGSVILGARYEFVVEIC